MLDDTEDADILTHLLPSIHFIEAELGKGRGVLVHCQAGISKFLPDSRSLSGLSNRCRPQLDYCRCVSHVQQENRPSGSP